MLTQRRCRRRAAAAAVSAAVASSSVFVPAALLGALWSAAPAWAQHADSEMDAEHNAMLNLVPTNQATHTAVADGNWASASTWSSGTVPGAGAKVVIPAGRTVTYNATSSPNIQWLRVSGNIVFSRSVSTVLNVDTVVIDTTGDWEQGTSANPIPANVTSTVTFTDTGAIDTTNYDPYFMSRGFLSHGRVRICGATVTPYVKASSGLAAGATGVTLQSAPTGWKAGDRVVVTGMAMKNVRNPVTTYFEPTPTDEVKSLTSVSGSSLTLDSGLVDRRVVEYGSFGLYPYVVNHSRNVLFTSANKTDASRKGHVMIMHNRAADIRYAAFWDLGRTRKDIDVTNSATQALPAGSNPRARYALHFHRTGKDDNTVVPSYVVGCSVANPTAWGYVNHDSYVVFEDDVCHNAFGSAFITENGGEIGTFRRCLASTTRGRGFIKDGTSTHDLARNGSAFWFQGGNVTVENNVATGANQGFSYFQRSGVNLGNSTVILKRNLIDPEAAGGNDSVQAADTPIMSFKDNTAVGCYEGFFSVDTEINGIWPTNSVIEGYVGLNAFGYNDLRMEYYRNLTFKNVKVLRDSTLPADPQYSGTWAINANHLVDHLYPWATRATDRHDGVYIRGYWNGIDNDDGDLGVSNGSPERIAKHDVIDNSIDFVGPGSVFANSGTLLGQSLVRYLSRAQILPFPTFSPAAGTYTTGQTVSISSPVAGATIYYVLGNDGYQVPSVESKIQPGQWTQYTGPISIPSGTKKLIAVVMKDGIYGRPRNGVFKIDPTSTPPPPSQTAYNGPHNLPKRIQAEDYDNGGSGVAYYDQDTANNGGQYRPSEQVDIEATTDTGGGFNVGWTNTNEWMEYTVDVPSGGATYDIDFRLASAGTGGSFQLESESGTNLTGALSVGGTGGWQTWTTVTKTGVALPGGRQVLRFKCNSGGFNLNWIEFRSASAPAPTTVTLTPTDDKDTQSDNASGTNAAINCSEWNTIYTRFSLASVTGTITSAKLRIYKNGATSNINMTAYGAANDSWTQATAPASLPAKGSAISPQVIPANAAGWVEFDVTAAVQAQYSGDKVISILLNTGPGNGWIGFSSKEGANAPQLVITRQ